MSFTVISQRTIKYIVVHNTVVKPLNVKFVFIEKFPTSKSVLNSRLGVGNPYQQMKRKIDKKIIDQQQFLL